MRTVNIYDLAKEASETRLIIDWPCGKDERLFFNGYQTWTTSREVTTDSYVGGVHRLPRPIINHWGIDRYGDYHFMNYPKHGEKGIFHGFSYCYKRCGDEYQLIGTLDDSDGYTIFEYDAQGGELTVKKDGPGAPRLFMAEGSESEVFDAWFSKMGIKSRDAVPLTGYSSWYNRYEKISDGTISEDLKGCEMVLSKGSLFQIDDGWEMKVGDWFPDNKKFPRGMKACADDIHAAGYLAGLWLAPFVTAMGSAIYKEHKDWLLTHEGKPWYCGCNWGGFWSLDIDNAEVQEYLRKTFDRVFNEWGYDLVKLDFLYGAAPWPTEGTGESRGARMYRAVRLLRKWCGDKLILGCGVPLWPAFGVFDYCRISCDVGLSWRNNFIMRHTNNECVSTVNAITNSFYRRQLNGRAFLNDPDVFFLRKDNIRLSNEEKKLLSHVNAQYGGLLLTSDNMGEYDEGQLKEYEEILEIWRNKTWKDLSFLVDLN